MIAALLGAVILSATSVESAATEPQPTGCTSSNDGMPDGPLSISFYGAEFATGRRACARSEVGLGGRGGVIIDTPHFYGSIGADGMVFGSFQLSPRAEVFATFDAVEYSWVQNAVFTGSTTTLGQLSVGASYAFWQLDRWTITPSVRLMLPTATASDVLTLGGELGAAAELRALERLTVHGYVGADFSAGISAAQSYPRTGFLLNAGAQWRALSWLALALDIDGHFGSTRAVDYLAPAFGLRFRIWTKLGAELGVTRSLLGEDRHAAMAAARISYRW